MLKQLLLILLISLPITTAATIQGTIFDLGFQPVENVILEIDTTPQQTIISTDGTYELEVSPGAYVLTATYINNGILESTAEEEIIITEEGTYSLDLLLFPSFEEDDLLEEDLGLDDEFFQPETTIPWTLVVILVVALFLVIFYKRRRKPVIIADDLEKLIQILKDSGNRINQKDLRKQLNLSEAKVSLMISDLESQGKVRKIKKGRGNIIILEKK